MSCLFYNIWICCLCSKYIHFHNILLLVLNDIDKNKNKKRRRKKERKNWLIFPELSILNVVEEETWHHDLWNYTHTHISMVLSSMKLQCSFFLLFLLS
jgi:hypothetical protein